MRKASPQQAERLTRVETRLDSMEQATRDGFTGLGAQVKEVHSCIDHLACKLDESMNGDAAKPGLVVRLDRLEQAHERQRFVVRAVIGTVITLVVGAAWALLRA